MECKARTFKQLEKEKTFEELKWLSQKITENYALIEYLTQAEIAKENQITVKCCRQLMDYAIVHGYVYRKIAIEVKDKAMKNSNRTEKEGENRSVLHHENLIRQREEYLVNLLAEGRIERIVKDIARNPHQPIRYFTGKYLLESNRMTRLIIERAIVVVIVDDKTVTLLEERNRKQKQGKRVERKKRKRFETLKEERRKVQCPYTTNCKCNFNYQCRNCKIQRDYRRHKLMLELEQHVENGDLLDYKGDNF